MVKRILIGLVSVLLWSLSAGTWADDDHYQSRRAFQAGEVMPLRTLLDKIEKDYPGQVLEVELEREQQQWYYEVKLLSDDGRLQKLIVDAKTGEVVGVKQKHKHKNEHRHAHPDSRR